MDATQNTQGIMDLGWTQDEEGDEPEAETVELNKTVEPIEIDDHSDDHNEDVVDHDEVDSAPPSPSRRASSSAPSSPGPGSPGPSSDPPSPALPPVQEDEPDILENRFNQPDNEPDEELIIRKRKKKQKPAKKQRPANGLKMSDFHDADEAEFDQEGDLANVSDDEDEKGNDEYEEEVILENLPSAQRQQKENAKIHQKLQRDDDQQQLKRMEEAFMGDEISQAKAKKRKYKWVLSNEFEGEEKGSSSEEDDAVDYDKAEAAQSAENERLKQKLARELMAEQEAEEQEQLFTQKSKLLATTTALKIKSKRKMVLSRGSSTSDKRKVRLNQAFSHGDRN